MRHGRPGADAGAAAPGTAPALAARAPRARRLAAAPSLRRRAIVPAAQAGLSRFATWVALGALTLPAAAWPGGAPFAAESAAAQAFAPHAQASAALPARDPTAHGPTARDPAALDPAIAAAVAHLHARIGLDGRFVYRIDARSGAVDTQGYNLLRHAGTLLVLAEHHAQVPPSPAQRQALQRAAGHLIDCCLAPAEDDGTVLALWSLPGSGEGARPYPVAKLGGSGLGLAALVQLEAVAPGSTPRATLRALGRFILAMQRADGGFRSLHGPRLSARDARWTSLYYPGEAVLGLVMLYELERDRAWLVAAVDALRHLARAREGVRSPPADHWALIATARLLALPVAELAGAATAALPWRGDGGEPGIKDGLRAHAAAIARAIVAEQHGADAVPVCAAGGFAAPGRTTPAATRVEGLIAARLVLPAGELRDAVDGALDATQPFLLGAQVRAGPAAGGFTRFVPGCDAGDPRAHEVRIDDVQHALAALRGLQARQHAAVALTDAAPVPSAAAVRPPAPAPASACAAGSPAACAAAVPHAR